MILKVDFAEDPRTMDLTFEEQSAAVDMQFDQVVEVVRSDADPYTGDYSVTPTLEGETLETKGKYMREDVTVQPIPVHRTTNAAGGYTVYIASTQEV